ncbi:sodium/solute symporter [Hellea sp.]|nr:sodium/solute symporter [Hellea sp.]MDA8887964.1 sodium/solute symporter [Hellea sp.]MDA9047900.1 sodium/solute symporter [Hellea sp.]MDB4845440.1 sodium/solute symporter [Hellea sp.]MDC0650979.1 sodium/solute symporter [Hellea sp.]
MEKFGLLNWTIVIAYLVGNLLLGWYLSRRVKTAKDYYLGDRSTPWWAIGISVIATYVSALSFLGGPAWAYGDGMAALAIHINYPLVMFVVIAVFLPFFYNSGVASIYDYLERRFGRSSRTVMSLLFLISQSITAASILTATAIVITYVTGVDAKIAICLMTAIVLIYTLLGGMNAVIWTDVLQGIILFIGAGIILFCLINAITPLSGALTSLAEDGKLNPLNTSLDLTIAPTVWAGVFAMTLFHITVYGANQMMVQRALAAKSIGDAKKSYLLMGYAAFFIYFLFFFVGALLYVYFEGQPFDQPNEIILRFANSLAIPGLMGILAAAVLSASMSSLSSAFNSLATISITDIYQSFLKKDGSDSHYLKSSRVMTVFWGIMVIPMAFAFISSEGSILEVLSKVASYFVGAKLAMFGMGFFSKHTTQRGLLIGVAAGFLGLLIIVGVFNIKGIYHNIAWPWYVVIGGGINITVSWVASIALGGFQKDWHPQTVIGQIQDFKSKGKIEKQDGWYLMPGRAEAPVWGLLGLFIIIIIFLSWFSTLG